MAKSHFSTRKHQKELARKLKQEKKMQRKLDKNSAKTEGAEDKDAAQRP
jgi:hypothetical protein